MSRLWSQVANALALDGRAPELNRRCSSAGDPLTTLAISLKYVRYPGLDEWVKEHPPMYESGDLVEVGDYVDFGFDGAFEDGPSLVLDAPWLGRVVDFYGPAVYVDTHLNSIQIFAAGELKLINRKREEQEDDDER